VNEALPVEDRIRIQGKGLLDSIPKTGGSPRLAWLDALLRRAVADPRFRVQALRFIDVLPSLPDDAALAAHLKEYFSGLELPWPALSAWSLKHSDSYWAVHIAAPLVRATLRGLSRRFMGGSHVQHALDTVARLRSKGMTYTLDLLGEAIVSEREAGDYQQAYIDLLKGLWRSSKDESRQLRPNVSLKLSSLYSQISPLDPAGSVAAITDRLRPILRTAIACDACVTIDMEQYDFKHIVMQCFMQLLMEPEFRDWPHAGIAVQAYLREARDDLQWLIDWAEERGTPILIRLVRGAYWDSESVIARQHGWDLPVWEYKGETDANFEACLDLLLSGYRSVRPAVATHNVRSLACAMVLAEQHGLANEDFEFQMLYGMADELKQALVDLGWSLRIYVPFGETLPGMAYLVRRLLENTSGLTILDAGMPGTGLDESCLERPVPWVARVGREPVKPFRNLPVHRFVASEERTAFAEAIVDAREQLGQEYPLLVNGAAVAGEGEIVSTNPAQPDEVIGSVAAAGQAEADMALAAARAAFPGWAERTAGERAGYLRRIAALLSEQRDRFAAWQVLEAGKPWREADADVCEAVDFLNYYAHRAERLGAARITELSGEHNAWSWRPRGVGLVITPWNFPLAILTGMLSATIVTGNTVILKPSSLTPVIAVRFMALLQEAGLPPGVVNCLPGSGGTLGAYLANSPGVHLIAFTGSREVGTQLLREGARIAEGQAHVKRVIAEMGGKNAIIIDDDADLDDAVPGVVQSAFGYQGQKCSAASRVIVVGDIHDSFVARLVDATASLAIGDPQHPGIRLGPVIDAPACERIRAAVARGGQTAQLVSRVRQDLPEQGHFLSPAIFTDVDPADPLAQEEIFGPVLAVLRAADFETALALANGTQYALTGGVYSRRPAHLARARAAFQVGNLYINRHITGALVSRQPFGGFRMSGIGSKAGGPDYLKQFMDPVCVTENTLRRGFAPDVDHKT